MPKEKKAPVAKRIYLTGQSLKWGRGYQVHVRDNQAQDVISTIGVPSYRAGNAIVRALRQLDTEKGTIW